MYSRPASGADAGERNTCRGGADAAGPETYLEVSEGLLGRRGLDVAHCRGKDTDSRGTREFFIFSILFYFLLLSSFVLSLFHFYFFLIYFSFLFYFYSVIVLLFFICCLFFVFVFLVVVVCSFDIFVLFSFVICLLCFYLFFVLSF